MMYILNFTKSDIVISESESMSAEFLSYSVFLSVSMSTSSLISMAVTTPSPFTSPYVPSGLK